MVYTLYLKKCLCSCEKLYFGFTTQNIETYNGSGVEWTKHLKTHNKGHKNIFIYEFENEELCEWFAIEYSYVNDIVKSQKFFNKMIECLSGGDTFNMKTDKEKKEINKKNSEKKKLYWENLSEEKKKERNEKSSKSLKLSWKNKSEEEKEEIRSKIKKSWINKSEEKKEKISEKIKKSWINMSEEKKKERNEKISEKQKLYWLNMSEEKKIELKKKNSESKKGIKYSRVSCIICHKEISINTFKK